MLDSDTPAEGTATPETSSTDTVDAPASDAPSAEARPAKKTAKKAPAKKATAKKTTAKKTTAKKATAKKAAAKKTTTRKAAAKTASPPTDADQPAPVDSEAVQTVPAPTDTPADAPATKKTAKKTAAKRAAKKTTTRKTAAQQPAAAEPPETPEEPAGEVATGEPADTVEDAAAGSVAPAFAAPLFQPPDPKKATAPRRKKAAKAPAAKAEEAAKDDTADEPTPEVPAEVSDDTGEETDEQAASRRRRRRGGRRRRKGGGGGDDQQTEPDEDQSEDQKSEESAADGDSAGTSSRRRRRRRRAGEEGDAPGDDPENTVTRVRKARSPEDEITALSGSTRLEAKKQRRREGREAGRRRAPIVSEAEFLARREAVDRVMVIRQREDLTQIAVLEDKVLVEHYVARESQASLIGNVYLGKVQNVLPSMEAAFIDIGKGRNAVLYAGEVNWDSLGAGNGPRKIEQVLKSGQSVLVQVTKDPVGHKGARLTSQISLPGRFLVYVPDGTTSGISRKLPDTERNRLKNLLKEIVPDTAGVIVRTAAEGASEDELTHDVERLTARWEDISGKVEKGSAPQLLYGEPDLTLKVVRDLFTEDFGTLVVSGSDAWDTVDGYVKHVAPDLADRLERYDGGDDVFAAYRIDEQIAKALDRKVWLPSGGSLIIDRTEAMTVVDVNTGKFTGSGGNLEETVTKNNLEAAEEIIRQLRLRDIGGIIVVDFIDMVLESNRDLVLRRMVECLGRDRTRHQVAEVTSLGLVQMTRKRIGTGLLEAFSESCEHCQGRGLLVHHEPVEPRKKAEEEPRRGRRSRGKGKSEGDGGNGNGGGSTAHGPSPKEFAAMAGKPVEVKAAEPQVTDGQPAEPAAVVDQRKVDQRKVDQIEPVEPVEAPPGEAEQPAASAASAPERGPEASSPEASSPEASSAEASSAEPEPEPETPVTPPAPTVVTSTRRRVARRPAGPPSGAAAATIVVVDRPETAEGETGSATGAAASSSDGAADGRSDAVDGAPAHAAAHVPVKRKGSRKR